MDAESGSGLNHFIITVSATDKGNPASSATGTIQVDIDDVDEFYPVFAQNIETATVAEGAAQDTA